MGWATYALVVDWNNNGSFADSGDDISADLFAFTIDRGFASPLARVAQAGRMTVSLFNTSKQYSPKLQANVLPSRAVRLNMTVGVTTVTLFRGFLKKIVPAPDIFGMKTVTIECVDAMEILDRVEASIPIIEYGRADQVIAAAVSAVYTPPSTSYESGINVFPYAGDRWTEAGEWGIGFERSRASQKIADACASDWGRFFINKAGGPTYKNRHYTAFNTTTLITLNGEFSNLNYEKSDGEVYNQIEVTCHPRVIGAEYEVLGRLSQSRAPRIEANASQTFKLDYRDPSNPALRIGARSLLNLVSGTDYKCTDDEGGEGTDVTASITPSYTLKADTAEVTLTNALSQPVYVQTLQVRGLPVRVREEVTKVSSDVTSINAYQKRTLSINAPLMNNDYEAQRLSEHLLALWKDPRDVVTGITLEGLFSDTWLAAIRDMELLDRVVLTEAQTGLSSYAGYVYRMQHQADADNGHRVTFDLETAYALGTPFRLDTSALNSGHVLIY